MINIIKKIDKFVISFNNNNKSKILNKCMKFFTRLGNMGLIWLVSALILLSIDKYQYYGKELLETLAIGAIICNLILKPIFERIRPYEKYKDLELIIPKLDDYSFPSGHTLASFSSTTIIFQINLVLGILSLIIAILISYSRIYLNVHYFSDVLCGMILGIIISLFIIIF